MSSQLHIYPGFVKDSPIPVMIVEIDDGKTSKKIGLGEVEFRQLYSVLGKLIEELDNGADD